jgi:hypothetical protein
MTADDAALIADGPHLAHCGAILKANGAAGAGRVAAGAGDQCDGALYLDAALALRFPARRVDRTSLDPPWARAD